MHFEWDIKLEIKSRQELDKSLSVFRHIASDKGNIWYAPENMMQLVSHLHGIPICTANKLLISSQLHKIIHLVLKGSTTSFDSPHSFATGQATLLWLIQAKDPLVGMIKRWDDELDRIVCICKSPF
jgi:hypothetical protein